MDICKVFVKLTDQKLLKSLHCHILTFLFLLVPHAKLRAKKAKKKRPDIMSVCVEWCIPFSWHSLHTSILLWSANISDIFGENVMNCYANHAPVIILIITVLKLLDPFSYKKLVFDRYLLQCILKVAKGRFMFQRSNYGFHNIIQILQIRPR